jgi:hypothetical protein
VWSVVTSVSEGHTTSSFYRELQSGMNLWMREWQTGCVVPIVSTRSAYKGLSGEPSREWTIGRRYVQVIILLQEVLGRINRLLSLIRHVPDWKRRVQQFFYCCVCIRYLGNVYTEPLPGNDRGILPSRCLATMGDTQKHTVMWSHKPTLFLAYFPYFQKNKVGLWDRVAVCVCLYLCIPPINVRMPKPIFMKLERISRRLGPSQRPS